MTPPWYWPEPWATISAIVFFVGWCVGQFFVSVWLLNRFYDRMDQRG